MVRMGSSYMYMSSDYCLIVTTCSLSPFSCYRYLKFSLISYHWDPNFGPWGDFYHNRITSSLGQRDGSHQPRNKLVKYFWDILTDTQTHRHTQEDHRKPRPAAGRFDYKNAPKCMWEINSHHLITSTFTIYHLYSCPFCDFQPIFYLHYICYIDHPRRLVS